MLAIFPVCQRGKNCSQRSFNKCFDETFKTQLFFKAKFKTWNCSIYGQWKHLQSVCINDVTVTRVITNMFFLNTTLNLFTNVIRCNKECNKNKKRKNVVKFWLCLTWSRRRSSKHSCRWKISNRIRLPHYSERFKPTRNQ